MDAISEMKYTPKVEKDGEDNRRQRNLLRRESLMPLFQRQKPLPLDGLLQSELVESDAFFESHGISKEMATQDPEGTRQLFRQYLEECVNQNHFNKVWVYHLLVIMLYSAEVKLEKIVSLFSRAASEHPADPRAYYSLGTIYYGIYEETLKPLTRADVQHAPWEIQELARQYREFQEENQQFVKACRESKLAASPEEAAKLALQHYRKTLACNISNDDKRRVQTHIRLIEVQLSL
jgi:hypothetical protein